MSFANLPFELVVRICRFNAHLLHASSDQREPVRDTIAASQVCHRWRSIVLSAPDLWRFSIDPYHPCASWRDLLLKRSEPLSIEFKDTHYAGKLARDLHDVELQMQSAAHLRLRRYDGQFDCRAETLSTSSAAWPSEPGSWPHLRHLSLCIDIDRNMRPEDHASSRLPDCLPDHFPGLATPILTHLTLTSFYMPDWSNLLTIGQTLTHLDICRPGSRLCTNQWVEIVRNLPNLEMLSFVLALELFCVHPRTNNRFTLGVREFVLHDLLQSCELLLDRIELSSKCRRSGITCIIVPPVLSQLGISEEDSVKAMLPHVKRLYSHAITQDSKLYLSNSLIMLESGLPEPASLLHRFMTPLTTKYSNHFYLLFDRHDENSAGDTPFNLSHMLDWVRPHCASFDIIETHEHCDELSEEEMDHLLEFLVQCRNLCVLLDVNLKLWKRLCKRLMAADSGISNDPLLPKFRFLAFGPRIQVKERDIAWDRIPFADLKAFCKHRASVGVPLERISVIDCGVFEMDSSGEIKSEPKPWDS